MIKLKVKVDNIAGWPDKGLIYIDDGSVPKGIYSFRKSKTKTKGKIPVPIYIKEYKNRVELSEVTLKYLEKFL